MKIAVFSVDQLSGEALSSLLTHTGGFEVVACSSNLGQAPEIIEAQRPDLLIVTEELDGPAWRIILAKLKKQYPVKMMLLHSKPLGSHNDELFDLVQSRWPGVSALCQAIRGLKVVGGPDVVVAVKMPQPSVSAPRRGRPPGSKNVKVPGRTGSGRALSARLSETAKLVAQGKENREIAAILGIAESTVKLYKSKLLKHFGLNNSVQLALKLNEQKYEEELKQAFERQ